MTTGKNDRTPDRKKNGPPFIDRPRPEQQDYNSRTGVTFYFRLPNVFSPARQRNLSKENTAREDSTFRALFPRSSWQKHRILLHFAVQSLPPNANRNQHRRKCPLLVPQTISKMGPNPSLVHRSLINERNEEIC